MYSVNVLKIRTLYSILFWLLPFIQLFLKMLSGKVNCVDHDQTAPSGSALFAYVILSDNLVFEILEHLP